MTLIACPVMFRDKSDARNTAKFAMSSGVCSRPRGILAWTDRSKCSLGVIPDWLSSRLMLRTAILSHMSVHSDPGQIALTLMLNGASPRA